MGDVINEKRFRVGHESSSSWPIEQAVVATVYGNNHLSPFGGHRCVYFEWAVGTTTDDNGAGPWGMFTHPTSTRDLLRFVSPDGLELEAHPGPIRFTLSPSFQRTWPAGEGAADPLVAHLRSEHTGTLTLREYCLVAGQMVMVTLKEESAWLPPTHAEGNPFEERSIRVHVAAVGADLERTPGSVGP